MQKICGLNVKICKTGNNREKYAIYGNMQKI